MIFRKTILCLGVALACSFSGMAEAPGGFLPGERVLVEAHNCYPYHGAWANRIDRALSAGFPVAIELDLAWHAEGNEGAGRAVLAHDAPFTDQEPTLRDYFFERVRPDIEAALASGDTSNWPLITLNINDIRSDEPAIYDEIWALTAEFESWLCTAVKGPAPDPVAPIDVKPILILTAGGAQEKEHFYDAVPEGGKLRLFGSGNRDGQADNFRRWINFPWNAVEPEGQRRAGEWTEADAGRLAALVKDAHQRGFWIRFYSLNGHPVTDLVRMGWSPGYNFGSLEAVRVRWQAAFEAGVDFIATDQIEDATKWLKSLR